MSAADISVIVLRPMSSPRPRSVVEQMAGYTPGEQPSPGEQVIKLNTNENPFPPSPRVVDAIRRVIPDALRRYPSSMADEFRVVAARVHGVPPESILAGNGSDDILQIALRTYCGPGDVLVCPDPTYSLYPVLAELADVRLVPLPRRCWVRAGAQFSSRTPTRRQGRGCQSQISRHWRREPRRSCSWTKRTRTLRMTTA